MRLKSARFAILLLIVSLFYFRAAIAQGAKPAAKAAPKAAPAGDTCTSRLWPIRMPDRRSVKAPSMAGSPARFRTSIRAIPWSATT